VDDDAGLFEAAFLSQGRDEGVLTGIIHNMMVRMAVSDRIIDGRMLDISCVKNTVIAAVQRQDLRKRQIP
jgi:hypothetical protein